jgi:ABC-type multidrug transport system permease subunit
METTMSNQAPQAQRQVRPQQRSTARADLNRIESAGVPWWFHSLAVFKTCAAVAVAPFRIAAGFAEAAVNVTFVVVFGSIGLWLAGYIPDAAVSALVNALGTRVLAILQGSGLL